MDDHTRQLRHMKRPKLLMTAARHAMRHYDRTRVLTRLLGRATLQSERAMDALLAREAEIELTRTTGAADYSPAAHIDLLTAILAEARGLTEPHADQL
ncbi:MAG: DUF6477 family protein [Pseudomonadota bacterium]|nr:DUF6477 family protein [Pseudomonadota bacterium]